MLPLRPICRWSRQADQEGLCRHGQDPLRLPALPFIGEESFRAAEATECAADQNKFWEYHDTVFENWKGVNEGHFSDDNLKLFASSLQLDRNAFDACFDSRKYLGKVEADLRRGEQLGVQGTPTLFLNGEMLAPTSYEELVQLIESAIADAQ